MVSLTITREDLQEAARVLTGSAARESLTLPLYPDRNRDGTGWLASRAAAGPFSEAEGSLILWTFDRPDRPLPAGVERDLLRGSASVRVGVGIGVGEQEGRVCGLARSGSGPAPDFLERVLVVGP